MFTLLKKYTVVSRVVEAFYAAALLYFVLIGNDALEICVHIDARVCHHGGQHLQ